ncbi:hypothetical protein [Nocardia sp. NPDC127526]|uniref:hypothetical protein n=1 Tax=Nocardia sp. NPDC127526 TaxID=3345393 RepID=UPI003637C122
MDLLSFFRGELPWAKLARFLRQLPDGSRYRASQAMDMDLAEHLVKLEEAEEAQRLTAPAEDADPIMRSSAGYDLSAHLLLTICDRLQILNATLIAVNLPPGKHPPQPEPMPRPVSAADVLRARHERDRAQDAMSAFGF